MTEKSIYEDVDILISLKKLIKYDLTASDYIFAYLIHIKEKWKLSVYNKGRRNKSKEDVEKLIENGYLEQITKDSSDLAVNNLKSTNLFEKLLNGDTDGNVENWIDEWYDLWPRGIKTGGYYLRADKWGSLAKMKGFMIKYPIYTKNKIIEATKNYLDEQSIDGYKYTKLAPYFISKNGLSTLAGECEELSEKKQTNVEDTYGQHEL